jgi:hypothetical protein
MKLNGHEVGIDYVSKIHDLQQAKQRPSLTDFIWKGKYKRQLRKRLKQLENDFDKGLVSEKSYAMWKRMINGVI